MTKKNIEARSHYESRHPASTYAECFPGQFDPTITPVVSAESTSGGVSGGGAGGAASHAAAAPAPTVPKKKAAQDLSFLDAALDTKAGGGKRK